MQTFVSQPCLDMYFSYTSVLGSHTFFMLFLPLMYLIVDQKFGRVYVYKRLLTLQPYSLLRIGCNLCSNAQGTMRMELRCQLHSHRTLSIAAKIKANAEERIRL